MKRIMGRIEEKMTFMEIENKALKDKVQVATSYATNYIPHSGYSAGYSGSSGPYLQGPSVNLNPSRKRNAEEAVKEDKSYDQHTKSIPKPKQPAYSPNVPSYNKARDYVKKADPHTIDFIFYIGKTTFTVIDLNTLVPKSYNYTSKFIGLGSRSLVTSDKRVFITGLSGETPYHKATHEFSLVDKNLFPRANMISGRGNHTHIELRKNELISIGGFDHQTKNTLSE